MKRRIMDIMLNKGITSSTSAENRIKPGYDTEEKGLKKITFINLELISLVLFAIVTFVGPRGLVTIVFQSDIVLFMLIVFVYYWRERKT